MKPVIRHYAFIIVCCFTIPNLYADPYLFANVGQADYDIEGDFSDTDTYFNLGIGFSLNKNASVEVGYQDFGRVTETVQSTTLTAEASAFNISVLGSLPLGKSFGVFGRLGFDIWDADINSASDTGADLFFGAGASYDVSQWSKITLEYQRHSLGFSDSGFDDDIDIDALSFGFKWQF